MTWEPSEQERAIGAIYDQASKTALKAGHPYLQQYYAGLMAVVDAARRGLLDWLEAELADEDNFRDIPAIFAEARAALGKEEQ